MKNKPIASVAMLLLGTAFLFASFPFADRAHAAPAGGYDSSIIELVYGCPALVFNIGGVCGIAAGTIVGVMALCEKPQS